MFIYVIFLYAIYLVILIFSSIYDIKYYIVKDVVHIIILILSLLKYSAESHMEQIFYNFIYAFSISILLLIISIKSNCMGGGDIKFIFANTVFLGFFVGYLGLFIGSIILVIMNIKNKNRKKIPMIPYISTGYVFANIYLILSNLS